MITYISIFSIFVLILDDEKYSKYYICINTEGVLKVENDTGNDLITGGDIAEVTSDDTDPSLSHICPRITSSPTCPGVY